MRTDQKTRECPFCGEEILADAAKCRWCREFLDEDADGLPVSNHALSRRRTAPQEKPQRPAEPEMLEIPGQLRFVPSLFAMAGVVLAALVMMAVAVALMGVPFEKFLQKFMEPQVSGSIAKWIDLAGFCMAIVVVMRVVFRALELKRTRYDISPDRIEWSRGIFSRHIDNLDMFRVVDLRLHRSLLDCLLGIGSVTLMTRDETDPVFEFEKVREPQQLYNLIKLASLAADRKQRVVHVE